MELGLGLHTIGRQLLVVKVGGIAALADQLLRHQEPREPLHEAHLQDQRLGLVLGVKVGVEGRGRGWGRGWGWVRVTLEVAGIAAIAQQLLRHQQPREQLHQAHMTLTEQS